MEIPRGAIFGVLVLIGAAVFLVLGNGGGGGFATDAAATCEEVRTELEALPQSPRSVTAALSMEHEMIATWERGVARLAALEPQANAAFRAGVADDQMLLRELNRMMSRPDFLQLSLTLPGHPNLVRPWMRRWHQRVLARQAAARRHFAAAGVPACEKSAG